MNLFARALSILLAASVSAQAAAARGPVLASKPASIPTFVLKDYGQLSSMVGTLGLGAFHSPEKTRLMVAGVTLLEKGPVLAVPVGKEVYLLSQEAKGGAVVSLEEDGGVKTSGVFKRLRGALKAAEGESAALDVAGNLAVMGKVFDGVEVLDEQLAWAGHGRVFKTREDLNGREEIRIWNPGDQQVARVAVPLSYKSYERLLMVDGSKDLMKLSSKKGARLGLLDHQTRRMTIYPGSAASLALDNAVLSPDKGTLLALDGRLLALRTLATGKTSHVKLQGGVQGLKLAAVSADGKFAALTRYRESGKGTLAIVDLRTGRTLRKAEVDGMDAVGFNRDDSGWLKIHFANYPEAGDYDWRRDL